MSTIRIKVPKESCEGCPYVYKEVIDHGYYGETTTHTVCRIFACPIDDLQKCPECTKRSAEEDDFLKYADFLVQKLNRLLE